MGFINKIRVILAIVLPILVMVLIKSFGINHFQSNVKRWAEPTVLRSNIISVEQAPTLSGKKLIINLDSQLNGISKMINDSICIPANSILNKENLKIIRKHTGPVLLYSAETNISAKIWMVLSQMGYKDIYILTIDIDNETFKSKFRPDTLVKPEL